MPPLSRLRLARTCTALSLASFLGGVALTPAAADNGLDLSWEDLTSGSLDVDALVTDLAASYAPQALRNRILPLSAGGAASNTGEEPMLGNLWIQDVSSTQRGDERLELKVSALGWRWVARSQEMLAAEFAVDEYLTFEVDLTLVGRLQINYDRERRYVTATFQPSEPVDLQFKLTGDLTVRTDDLWSSIVGGAADLMGQSVEERGRKAARQQTVQRLRDRLEGGITIVLDLCNGRRTVRFGESRGDPFPRNLDENVATNQRARLHQDGWLFAGPHEVSRPAEARLEIEGEAAVEALWLRQEDAQAVAEALVAEDSIPNLQPLARQVIRGRGTLRLDPPAGGVTAVLAMRPAAPAGLPANYRYILAGEGVAPEPLVDCSDLR